MLFFFKHRNSVSGAVPNFLEALGLRMCMLEHANTHTHTDTGQGKNVWASERLLSL